MRCRKLTCPTFFLAWLWTPQPHMYDKEKLCGSIQTTGFVGQADGLHDIFIFLPANWCSTCHVRRQRKFISGWTEAEKVRRLLIVYFSLSSVVQGPAELTTVRWSSEMALPEIEETPRRDVRDYDCCFYFYLWLVKGKVKFYILTFSDQLILNLFFLF